MNQYQVDESNAYIRIENESIHDEANGGNIYSFDFSVRDSSNSYAVIASQETTGALLFVPNGTTDIPYYLATQYQIYVYDGLIWYLAIKAKQND